MTTKDKSAERLLKMSKREDKETSLDLRNLEKTLDDLKIKKEEMKGFKIMRYGILIGILISIPIQLLLLPFSYEGTTMKYHGKILWENTPINEYIVFFIIILIVAIGISTEIYKSVFVSLTPRKKVSLAYKGNYKEVYNNLRKFIEKECSYLGLKSITKPYEEICCYRRDYPSLSESEPLDSDDVILIIKFEQNLNSLDITFKPEDRDSIYLIDKLRKKY